MPPDVVLPLRQDGLRRRRIHIFMDNQAAITRTTHLTQGSRQETTRLIHEIATDINNTNSTITVHWVPGHTTIPGNDEAHALTKQATSTEPSTPSPVTLYGSAAESGSNTPPTGRPGSTKTPNRRRTPRPSVADWTMHTPPSPANSPLPS
jgi:hypothetical protein